MSKQAQAATKRWHNASSMPGSSSPAFGLEPWMCGYRVGAARAWQRRGHSGSSGHWHWGARFYLPHLRSTVLQSMPRDSRWKWAFLQTLAHLHFECKLKISIDFMKSPPFCIKSGMSHQDKTCPHLRPPIPNQASLPLVNSISPCSDTKYRYTMQCVACRKQMWYSSLGSLHRRVMEGCDICYDL